MNKKRSFGGKFKLDVVIGWFKRGKAFNTLAAENHIQPSLFHKWKKVFLNNTSAMFDDKREERRKDKLVKKRKEKTEYGKKVGQVTM